MPSPLEEFKRELNNLRQQGVDTSILDAAERSYITMADDADSKLEQKQEAERIKRGLSTGQS